MILPLLLGVNLKNVVIPNDSGEDLEDLDASQVLSHACSDASGELEKLVVSTVPMSLDDL